jgi:hypothetical protein
MDGPAPLLKLEGSLLEPWIAEIERLTVDPGNAGNALQLDLLGLKFADAAGTKFLSELIRRGAKVISCSGYVAAVLHVEDS